MRNLVFGAVLVLMGAAPALAQETGASCSAVAGDGERLACYDGVFRAGNSIPAQAVVIKSQSSIPAFPNGREPAVMSIACEAAALRVSFRFAGQPMSSTSDIAPVTFQVDQGITSVRSLSASPDNTSVSFGAGRDSLAFLDSLAGGIDLKVRVTPARQRSLNVVFRLSANAEQIAELRASCR